MSQFIYCVRASDGVAALPCGTLDGVAYAPVVYEPDSSPVEIDTAQAAQLFGWSFSLVMISFVVGFTVGAIVRVIRAA
ncbi:hypothetical protein [Novosphingobium album (ex Liu et al. 2023)]|uniref:DUF3592 domain-containing protein n=1 Tax=Novosphingobium album (ex Liu et al. 2023) TaxID=3031130 RepID=A0ABT5WPB1_9SPHN|nr:hypothetical protein [Novosphingobium album (ex Liu et al. 2023)]MDE8651890.1 hypothetical protein [Novosphingobium album (ex Liu et al. 2023)]